MIQSTLYCSSFGSERLTDDGFIDGTEAYNAALTATPVMSCSVGKIVHHIPEQIHYVAINKYT